jgi:ribosomal protein L15
LARRVKVFLSGTINKTVHLEGIAVTPKVKAAIESAGGSVTMPPIKTKTKTKTKKTEQ